MWPQIGLGVVLTVVLVVGMAHRTKTDENHVLGHPLRKRIVEALRLRPGRRLADLGALVQSATSTTLYHLFVLERIGVIRSTHRSDATRYFPAETPDADGWALLLRGRIMDMAIYILHKPGASQKEILGVLTMNRKVFRDYADVLLEEQLVTEEKIWRGRLYFPTPRLEKLAPVIGQENGRGNESRRQGEGLQ